MMARKTHKGWLGLLVILVSTSYCSSFSAIAAGKESITNLLYTEKGLAGKAVLIQENEFNYSGSIEVGWNNRRLKISESITLAPNGMPVAFKAHGQSAFGSAINESFILKNNQAQWESAKDTGSMKVSTPRFYVPADSTIAANAALVKALLASPSKTIALLPSGHASLTVLNEQEIENGGNRAHVYLYAISGMDFTPDFAWFDDKGRLFAQNMGGFMRIIREGFSLDNLTVLSEIQLREEKSYLENMADKLSYSYTQLLIQGSNVVDVEQGKLLSQTDVLLENGKIKKIAKHIPLEDNMQIIDGRGKTLLPGLWDMHGHLSKDDGLLDIAAGVTNVRDMGSNHDSIMEIESLFNSNQIIGPHVYRAGFMDQKSEYSAGLSVESLEEALNTVDWFADNGYIQIKLYSSIDPTWVKPLADRAHNRGLRVSGHIPAFMTAEQAVNAGYDEIQHINMIFLNFLAGTHADTRQQLRFSLIGENAGSMDLNSPEMKRFIKLLADKRVTVDPTVSTFRSLLIAEDRRTNPEYLAIVDHLPPTASRQLKGASMKVSATELIEYKKSADALVEMVKVLYDNQVPIVPGTDNLTGFTLHRELELYEQAGIPAFDILAIASIQSANLVGAGHVSGSIKEGKNADVILVDGDPTKRMSDIRKVSLVVKDNHFYKPAELYRTLGVKPFTQPLIVSQPQSTQLH
ncbi:amidohydrolase family protein [Shewanella surugensis]|uniref:Amidohydrolase family protein n=1 Tax=Shewanella surugensis TaxID=212020 RepID=A0ABT0LE76_9GAMM|nr:amidohydrolase family protein [Shewanella surugensis]MCL1125859.1 amidohydrolase family protein [Shewanella surugensis]